MAEKKSTEKYMEAVGRRKTSTARVRIWPGVKVNFVVNGKDAKEYFKTEVERRLVQDPIIKGMAGVKSNGTSKQEFLVEALIHKQKLYAMVCHVP